MIRTLHRWQIAIATLTLMGAMLALRPVYATWDRETVSQLLWNTDEAFLFVGLRRDGQWFRSASWGWMLVKQYVLNLPNQTEHFANSVVLLHFDGTKVSRYLLENTQFDWYRVSENRVYGSYQGAQGRWTGRGFEPVSFDEARRAAFVTSGKVPGWSADINLLATAPGSRVEHRMSIRGQDVVVVASKAPNGLSKTIDLVMNDQRETLFQVYEGPRYVSRDEFERLRRQTLGGEPD